MRSFFYGVSCVIPAMNPSVKIRILSHGYLAIVFFTWVSFMSV